MASGCPSVTNSLIGGPGGDPKHAVAFPDGSPVSNGHTLVVPKRHVASLWDLPPSEQHDIWDLVSQVRALLTSRHSPGGAGGGKAAAVGHHSTLPLTWKAVYPIGRNQLRTPCRIKGR